MDLVLALAKRENAELAIANDPDADRLAVAVRDAGGGYVMLSGNEVGVLMGDALLARPARTRSRVVICTIVSSPMLGAIAAAHGAQWETTLTGFKWIANRALELEAAPDTEFVFGYEEALGYSVGDVVRDKDGIGAAVVMADIAATAAEAGQSLLDVLEAAYRRYGLYLSRQVAVTMPGLDGAARIGRIMDAVRKAPPRELAGRAILAVHDRDQGTTLRADGTKSRIDGPMSNVLLFDVDGGHRVTLRPSGTEPKIKYYFDVRETLAPGESLEEGRRRGEATIDTFVKALAVITDAIA